MSSPRANRLRLQRKGNPQPRVIVIPVATTSQPHYPSRPPPRTTNPLLQRYPRPHRPPTPQTPCHRKPRRSRRHLRLRTFHPRPSPPTCPTFHRQRRRLVPQADRVHKHRLTPRPPLDMKPVKPRPHPGLPATEPMQVLPKLAWTTPHDQTLPSLQRQRLPLPIILPQGWRVQAVPQKAARRPRIRPTATSNLP